MNLLKQWIRRLTATVSNHGHDRRTEEELQLHLDMETEAGVRAGVSPDEARRNARRRHGGALAAREAVRDQRVLPRLADLYGDLRISARGLLRQRGFTAVALTALTLAVAINTLIFALVDGVLLRPLPYPEPDRLFRISETDDPSRPGGMAIGPFLAIAESSRTLENVAIYTQEDVQLTHADRAENLAAVRISPRFFATLGAQPMLGRNFTEEDMRGSSAVAILSHSLWRTRFEQDPEIVGRTIRIDREPWTVIGVMPPGFEHVGGGYRSPLQGETVALWRPAAFDLPQHGLYRWHFVNAVARLAPGVTREQAKQELDRIVAETEKLAPDVHEGSQAFLQPLNDAVVGTSRETLLLLIGAGALVLLIAGANVAGLCVARGLARNREAAIRLALGARTGRLIQALVSENALLGAAGGVLGLALCAAALPLFRTILPADFPRLHAIALMPGVAAFALASALAVAMLAGLPTAFRQSRRHPREALQEAPRGSSTSRTARGVRSALVTAEIALAALLCASALLLARSAAMLDNRDHHFDPGRTLTFALNVPGTPYGNDESQALLHDELLRRWREIPGVEAAALGTDVPWSGYDENSGFEIVGAPPGSGESGGRYHAATPGYFESLRIPVLQGRAFDERDRLDAPPVLIVNESLVRRYFPDSVPLGRVLDVFGKRREIVGVVADVLDRPSDADTRPAFWFPLAQQPFRGLAAVVRAEGDPLALAQAVTGALRDADAELAAADIRSLETVAAAALAERRFAQWMFDAFAFLGLTLSAVGVYGLLAYMAEQRRKELGIRMALGARRSQIVGMVMRDGARLCAAGALAGLALVPLAGKGLSGFLFGVGAADPVSLVTALAVILTVGLTASFVPAWIAGRNPPMATLREE